MKTVTSPRSSVPCPPRRPALRVLAAALVAVAMTGCCTRPGQPPTVDVNIQGTMVTMPNGPYYWAWQEYDDCIDFANLMIFGLLASAHSHRYAQDPRGPAPSSGSPPAQQAPPPGGD